MLPKKYRLRRKKEIEKILKEGKKITSKSFFLYFLENNLLFPRAAFSVSKKVSGRAVVRNKIKRWLREIFRQEILKNDISFDFLLVVKKEVLEKDFFLLKKEIKEVFEKITKKL